ncbi:MAG TPA: NAD-glutamate dehydrogenase [Burkholderiales bacterium]|nr:NAD-glutamate dehydrogenase [Burkholderiales bacterium]
MAATTTPRPEQQKKAGQIETVIDYARSRLPSEQRDQADPLLRAYYAEVDPEELSERSVADLYGAALAHLKFARRFSFGAPKIRVYNPVFAEHGWQSTHTVVEVVNDDMPFLVDSVTMEANRLGLTVHLMIHPVVRVRRDDTGNLIEINPGSEREGGRLESFIHMEVDRRTDRETLQQLEDGIVRVLGDVRVAVEDWERMAQRMYGSISDAEKQAAPDDPEQVREELEFLRWLIDNHFTFLGSRTYDLAKEGGEDVLRIVPGSGLGILRRTQRTVSESFAALPPQARERARAKDLLILTKANSRATVHRPGYLDYVGVKRFNTAGEVIGETRFLGLYTSAAYHANPTDIPLLRRKVRAVLERAGLLPGSHSEKTLATILESYPRDELIQAPVEVLYEHAMGILRLGERQRTRLFVRRDVYGRSISCLIYVPRENYNTELRVRMQELLKQAFNGTGTEFTVHLSESMLARIHLVVRTSPGTIPEYDVRDLEARIVQAAHRWEDDLKLALVANCGEERGNELYRKFGAAFPAGYRDDHAPQSAVFDIEQMATLDSPARLGMNLYAPAEAPSGTLRFKVYHLGSPVPLSDSLPMLEHMGVRVMQERPYRIDREGAPVWVADLALTYAGDGELPVDAVRAMFQETFEGMWSGAIEADDFNRLVLRARLPAREIAVLRAYAKYLRQTGFNFSQAYIQAALAAQPVIARLLVELFKRRFDPSPVADRGVRCAEIAAQIEQALDRVTSLDEDRILRQYLALIQASLRTNYYQRTPDGTAKPYLSIKYDPAKVPGLPEPLPKFEVFVYSPRMEGVHLRGGKVARGGIRWSDRMEDFRTEVLGLMKAQMVKNVVIVPVGSKGGFVLKRPPAGGDRDALLKEGVACYQTLLRGLLDITDNLVAGKIVPPQHVVRHDPDDPYLVVAADKGTATFSDYANGVSREYGFWLDDAFASGGSAGYDHKKMGITARGAWESVKRHFRALGHDTQTGDFTVAGIGDMSGDVFGNGMLLSQHIRLVAAFDHRHVFLDPAPNAAASFRERDRLFKLPRSSWADYDAKLISKGGGVYPRSAKSIPLSPEIRDVLEIKAEALAPNDLISAILRAPVDLLYNGGIGTYVKSSRESNVDVGDRTNDAIRVNGAQLRSKVVAEGGNLGFTQRGRIEYASTGGRINTDAIDNSAGVDCSDHEVNIKILLGAVVRDGEMTEKQRNKLLADMTDEVAALVLRDNTFQTQSLAVSGAMAPGLLESQERFIRSLERAGKLNRALEFLPSDEEIAERRAAKRGLTAPEAAVLLAYSKIALYDELLASDVPDEPYIGTAIERYFPQPLRAPYRSYIGSHPLRREIIATHVTNSMVNRVGSTFVDRLQEETGASSPDVVRAYIVAREVFGLVDFWRAVESLDGKIADSLQTEMVIAAGRLIVRATLWLLRNRSYLADVSKSIERFQPGARTLAKALPDMLPESERNACRQAQARFASKGVDEVLAARVATFDSQFAALDVVEVAAALKSEADVVARLYFALGGRLEFPWLRSRIDRLAATSHWHTLAKAALRDDLASMQRQLTAVALRAAPNERDPARLAALWEAAHKNVLERFSQVLADLRTAEAPDLAMLSVAMRELRNLAARS